MIGFPEDLERIGRREVQAFFRRHYGPRSLTIAVAGDVKPEQIRRLAERYFGSWQPGEASGGAPGVCDSSGALGGPLAAPPRGREGAAGRGTASAWEYRARSRAGPALMHAYYRPCINSPDSVPLDMARCVHCGGATWARRGDGADWRLLYFKHWPPTCFISAPCNRQPRLQTVFQQSRMRCHTCGTTLLNNIHSGAAPSPLQRAFLTCQRLLPAQPHQTCSDPANLHARPPPLPPPLAATC